MTSLELVYWLQWFLEVSKPQVITKEQIELIEEHISLVLNKVTTKQVVNNLKRFNDMEQLIGVRSPTQKELEENMFKVQNPVVYLNDGVSVSNGFDVDLTEENAAKINCTIVHEGSC